jgi:hypothetical protein
LELKLDKKGVETFNARAKNLKLKLWKYFIVPVPPTPTSFCLDEEELEYVY